MSRVLVLGVSGMLGRSVYLELRTSLLKVAGTKRSLLDGKDSELLKFSVEDRKSVV